MNVEYINPFFLGACSVLEIVLGETPIKEGLAAQPTAFTSQQCNIVCGVNGRAQGQVIYGMPLSVADRIASHMLGEPIKTFDALAASAIAELGNMISGSAMQNFHEAGYICNITPPTLVRGNNVEISTVSIPAIVIRLKTSKGSFSITVGLKAGNDTAVLQ